MSATKLRQDMQIAFTTKKSYIGIICKNCPYNSVGFERNYFAATKCCCFSTKYYQCCECCAKLRNSFNYKVRKAFVRGDVKKIPYEIIPIEDYLYNYVKVSPFSIFDFVNEYIDIRLDNINKVIFYLQKNS